MPLALRPLRLASLAFVVSSALGIFGLAACDDGDSPADTTSSSSTTGSTGSGNNTETGWAASCQAEFDKDTACGDTPDVGKPDSCKAKASCWDAAYKPEFHKAYASCYANAACDSNKEDTCFANAAETTPATPATTDAEAKCFAKVKECGDKFNEDYCPILQGTADELATKFSACTQKACDEANTCGNALFKDAFVPCGGD